MASDEVEELEGADSLMWGARGELETTWGKGGRCAENRGHQLFVKKLIWSNAQIKRHFKKFQTQFSSFREGFY